MEGSFESQGGGSGGGGGGGGGLGGISVEKEERVTRSSTTVTGFTHKSCKDNRVGQASH